MAKKKGKKAKRTKAAARLKRTVKRKTTVKRKPARMKAAGPKQRQKKAPQRRLAVGPKKAISSIPQSKLSKSEQEIGFISHYFTEIGVGIIELTKGVLSNRDKVHVKGSTTDFIQIIDSMQYEHQPIQSAKAGQSIGVKVSQRVR